MKLVIDTRETINDITSLSDQLLGLMVENFVADEIVVVCIGTDRVVGDSLGPIVGSRLKRNKNYTVYGTIDDPVHALNLRDTCEHVMLNHPHALVIAIDASLGKREDVGIIKVRHRPIAPGSGFGKALPPIGDVSIVGVVSKMDDRYTSLHQVRLCDVLVMSDTITRIVEKTVKEWKEITNAK